MTHHPAPAVLPLDMAVRVGCEIVYETDVPTPTLVAFKAKEDFFQRIAQEHIEFEPRLAATEFQDDHDNTIYRMMLKPGINRFRYDAIVMVSSVCEDAAWLDEPILPNLLSAPILRYTFPSRYCDSDK